MTRFLSYLVFAAALATPTAVASAAGWVFSPSSIDTGKIQSGGPPKDGIPALIAPRYITADEADFLSGSDRVLGLEIDGDARAYPLRILSWHELVNDSVGGEEILVSW